MSRARESLQWPRAGAVDVEGLGIDNDQIPAEIVTATCEAAYREVTTPNSLAPDVAAGGGVASRIKAGSVEVEFANSGTTLPSFPAIDQALASLFIVRGSLSGRLIRG